MGKEVGGVLLLTLLSVAVLAAGCGDEGGNGGGGTTLVLKNDSFSGGSVSFLGGFVSGEEGAATLGPVSRTFTVSKVLFLFGGATSQETVTLIIYTDTGAASPGGQLFTADYQITGSNSSLQEIDLSGDNIVVSGGGSIRVSILFNHNGFPSLAHDASGSATAGRNWLNLGGWVDAADMSVGGDLILRAEVVTQ